MNLKSQKAFQYDLNLENYRSKVDYSVRNGKKTKIDETQDSILRNLKKVQTKELNITKDSKSSLVSAPNDFSCYLNLTNFRSFSGLGDFKKSVSSFNSPAQRNNKQEAGFSFSHIYRGSSLLNGNDGLMVSKGVDISRPLVEVLSIGTLNKATRVVVGNGLEKVSFSYLRQLKQFCAIVMEGLDN